MPTILAYDFVIFLVILSHNITKFKMGHNKKLVLLTSNCFKMLCMRSKTKKADKIREYYLELD